MSTGRSAENSNQEAQLTCFTEMMLMWTLIGVRKSGGGEAKPEPRPWDLEGWELEKRLGGDLQAVVTDWMLRGQGLERYLCYLSLDIVYVFN